MQYDELKRCHECGRVYDGDECPECGYYAQEYFAPMEYDEQDDIDALLDEIISENGVHDD